MFRAARIVGIGILALGILAGTAGRASALLHLQLHPQRRRSTRSSSSTGSPASTSSSASCELLVRHRRRAAEDGGATVFTTHREPVQLDARRAASS